MAERAQYQGTGKRKTSVARVILRPGDGATWFNGRTIEEYFPRATHRMLALGLERDRIELSAGREVGLRGVA